MGNGRPLDRDTRRFFEPRFGRDLSGVRIHASEQDGALARSFSARAFTTGSDIVFAPGQYAPGTDAGRGLIAHELAHVVQPTAPGTIARDTDGGVTTAPADSGATGPTDAGVAPVPAGVPPAPPPPLFDSSFGTRATEEEGRRRDAFALRYLRCALRRRGAGVVAALATVCARQAASARRAGGARHYPIGHAVGMTFGCIGRLRHADRMALQEARHAVGGPCALRRYADPAKTPSSPVSPSYPESVGFAPTHNELGWLRSPTDTHPAQLYDYPGFARGSINHQFETVAQGMDNQTAYGALHWGFKIRAGAPTDEFTFSAPVPTPTFDIALERFRTVFTHEPVIVYFDTDRDTPTAAEAAKLAEVTTWMAVHSDVHLEIEGFADERGRVGYNKDLYQRRAEMVAALLLGRGVDPTRIDSITGRGETVSFAAGAEAGQLQANRRTRIRFVRTATEMPSA